MPAAWRILTHPTGPWIIHTEGGRWLVPADLGRRLLPLAGHRPTRDQVLACLDAAPAAPGEETLDHRLADRLLAPTDPHRPGRSRRPALWGRFPLLSARWTGRLARPLEGLVTARGFWWLGLAPPALAVLVWRSPCPTLDSAADLVAGVGLFLLGAMLHELGHAAALAGQGYPAGGIGGGVLFILPVLHNDVSAVTMLPRRGRLRVDLAGVLLQSGYGLALVLTALADAGGAAGLAARLTLLAVIWSLLPFIRSDAYFALGDLLGVEDPAHPAPPDMGANGRRALLAFKVFNLVFLLLVTGWMSLRWGRLPGPWSWPLLAVVWTMVGLRVRGLWGSLGGDLRNLRRGEISSRQAGEPCRSEARPSRTQR